MFVAIAFKNGGDILVFYFHDDISLLSQVCSVNLLLLMRSAMMGTVGAKARYFAMLFCARTVFSPYF